MRLLFIANDFPNPLEPTKAVFNLHLVRALAREHEIQVISPVSWVDEFAARRAGKKLAKDRWGVIEGLSVHYPRYFYTPKILRSRYGWFYWRSIRGLVKSLIQSQRPDAVLAYWAHPDGEAAVRAARLAGVPSAVIVGGSDVQSITENAARYRRVENVLRSTDAVIAVSRNLKERVETFGVDPARIHVWSQGVDSAVFFPGSKSAARARLSIDNKGLKFLWVGRMVPVKGLGTLLHACALLRKRELNFHFYLIGDGPERGTIETEAAQRGLTDAITFVGSKNPEELGDWYRAADLFVMSSQSEGLPNVLRESLACGTPFVASNVGGISEIAGESNGLFPAGDAEAMAREILETVDSNRAGANQPAPLTWTESAREIVKILESTNQQAVAVKEGGSYWSPRQITRKLMAATLPRGLFITHGPRNSGAVCLTFDDGPHPVHTPKILDVLATEGVKATFFVLGEQAEKHPQLIRRIVAEGHALAQHSYLHLPRTTAVQLIESIKQTQEALAGITTAKTNLFRPPYGAVSIAKLWRLWREKQTVVLWNRDPRDYTRKNADEIIAWARRQPLAGGDIMLLHDVYGPTAAALPELIQSTRKAGLSFTTIDHWTSETAEAEHELVEA